MEKKLTSYTVVTALLALTSCVQEGPGGNGLADVDNRIYFRSSLPTVTETRAGIVANENLKECRVTCINPEDETKIDEDGNIDYYFNDTRFLKRADGHFLADDEENAIWPNANNRLHFFAYYPDEDTMRGEMDAKYCKPTNSSLSTDGDYILDYKIGNFRVARDIADQVDFIAAYSTATLLENGNKPIELSFTHQLTRLDISAWGASEKYDFEIAGVRIGNPVTQGDFCFSSLYSDDPAWINREGDPDVVEHIFTTGESTVILSKERESHSSAGDAASIMGNAGPAMVIPMAERVDAWEGKADPDIDNPGYTTDKLYLSVLLRVTNRDNETVYPYPNNCDLIPVTYLVVGSDGKVVRRVYPIGDKYYTSDIESEEFLYTLADTEVVRDFCWAALPITGGAKWEAGKIYSYKLNYTNGIGWQDPDDPTPGDPIIERGLVPFEVNVAEWVEAEDHDPNLDVPKR